MRSRPLKIFLLLAVFLIIAGSAFVFFRFFYPLPIEATVKTETAKRITLPAFEMDGKTYNVNGGTIIENSTDKPVSLFEKRKLLGLIYFYLQTEKDPLIAIEGTNVREFQKTMDASVNTAHFYSFDNIYKNNDLYKDFIAVHSFFGNFTPINFIYDTEITEQKRQNMLAQPSLNAALDYVQALEIAAKDYKMGADNFLKSFDAALSDANWSPEVIFLRSATSIGKLKEFNQDAVENAGQLAEEVANRKDCLINQKNCEPLADFSDFQKIVEAIDSEQTLPLQMVSAAEKAWNIPFKFGDFRAQTKCFSGPDISQPKNFTFAAYELPSLSPLKAIKFKTLNDSYFIDIKNINVPAYQSILKAGESYYWQPETQHYMCPDLSYQNTLATMIDIRDHLSAAPIFTNMLKNVGDNRFSDTADELNRMESSWLRGQIISDVDMQKYMEGLAMLLDQMPEQQWRDSFGGSSYPRAVRLANEYKGKSGLLDRLLYSVFISNLDFRLSYLTSDDKNLVPPAFLYLTHAAPTLMFMPTNESVWRIKKKPDLFIKPEDPNIFNIYKSYSELKNMLSEKHIEKIMSLSVGVTLDAEEQYRLQQLSPKK